MFFSKLKKQTNEIKTINQLKIEKGEMISSQKEIREIVPVLNFYKKNV